MYQKFHIFNAKFEEKRVGRSPQEILTRSTYRNILISLQGTIWRQNGIVPRYSKFSIILSLWSAWLLILGILPVNSCYTQANIHTFQPMCKFNLKIQIPVTVILWFHSSSQNLILARWHNNVTWKKSCVAADAHDCIFLTRKAESPFLDLGCIAIVAQVKSL
jgi:hypothetical protein